MALQLGFDGAIRLIADGDEASMLEVLKLTSPKYEAFCAAIDQGESERAVYWRIVFAILSVHSPIDATFEAYRTLRCGGRGTHECLRYPLRHESCAWRAGQMAWCSTRIRRRTTSTSLT